MQIQAIEFAVNHCWQMDKDCRKKKQHEIKEDEEEGDEYNDNSDKDPLYCECPMYGSKKKYIEEKFISKNL